MLAHLDSYAAVCSAFHWNIPEFFNIGIDVCDKWAHEPTRLALIHQRHDGTVERATFADLKQRSNQLANLFRAHGLQVGDRLGILLPQLPETALCHVAAYKIGAIAVPLFTLFGVDALRYRLNDSGIKLLVTNQIGLAKIIQIRAACPELAQVFCIDGDAAGALDLHRCAAPLSSTFEVHRTRAEDPALLIYTSGTTGSPKGALHAHRSLLGHLPGVEMSHDLLGQPGDLLWTPADWAWIGGLMDVLMPAWHHGIPVLAHRFEKFDAVAAMNLMQRHAVRNAFLPPTALKMLRALPDLSRWKLNLRSIASGGESLGAEMLEWGRANFGIDINEFYGQTECNMVVSSCSRWFPPKPGAIGKAAPGHKVAIVDDSGNLLPDGSVGNIAMRAPDPVLFLGYWRNENATREKFVGDWLLSGDTGTLDSEGYLTFVGRDDDVITSGGYRIGPGPIEDCLLSHPAVQLAAVVGAPDAQRTEIVKAYVVLRPGFAPDDTLTAELQQHVRTRLAAHEFPRQVRYVDSLPTTATGKIIRRELRSRQD